MEVVERNPGIDGLLLPVGGAAGAVAQAEPAPEGMPAFSQHLQAALRQNLPVDVAPLAPLANAAPVSESVLAALPLIQPAAALDEVMALLAKALATPGVDTPSEDPATADDLAALVERMGVAGWIPEGDGFVLVVASPTPVTSTSSGAAGSTAESSPADESSPEESDADLTVPLHLLQAVLECLVTARGPVTSHNVTDMPTRQPSRSPDAAPSAPPAGLILALGKPSPAATSAPLAVNTSTETSFLPVRATVERPRLEPSAQERTQIEAPTLIHTEIVDAPVFLPATNAVPRQAATPTAPAQNDVETESEAVTDSRPQSLPVPAMMPIAAVVPETAPPLRTPSFVVPGKSAAVQPIIEAAVAPATSTAPVVTARKDAITARSDTELVTATDVGTSRSEPSAAPESTPTPRAASETKSAPNPTRAADPDPNSQSAPDTPFELHEVDRGATRAHQSEGTPVLRVNETGITESPESAGVPTRDPHAMVQRLAELVWGAHETGRELAVRLAPPELGPLLIEVRSEQGVITARLETHTDAAQQTLQQHVSQLHEALAQRGAAIDRIDVVRSESQDARSESYTDARWTGTGGQTRQDQREAPRRPSRLMARMRESTRTDVMQPRPELGLREINVRI